MTQHKNAQTEFYDGVFGNVKTVFVRNLNSFKLSNDPTQKWTQPVGHPLGGVVSSATTINTTGTAATRIGNAAAAATVVGNVVTATAGNSGLALQNGEARVTVTNSLGNTHGLVVGESSTALSGGTRSTNLTLNDSGATFSNAATGAPSRVTGVANGAGDFDAVNVRQFSSAVAGVVASANIPGVRHCGTEF